MHQRLGFVAATELEAVTWFERSTLWVYYALTIRILEDIVL